MQSSVDVMEDGDGLEVEDVELPPPELSEVSVFFTTTTKNVLKWFVGIYV